MIGYAIRAMFVIGMVVLGAWVVACVLTFGYIVAHP